MSNSSGIEWTDATWNPVVGCQYASEGCRNCYAATMTKRLAAMGKSDYRGLINDAGHFNGTLRVLPHKLTAPLGWRKPRMVFVNSMSDLFHPSVPLDYIDKVFAVMALCPQHTFQVLTKRPRRTAEYLDGLDRPTRIADASKECTPWRGSRRNFRSAANGPGFADRVLWPIPNIWLGTSVENQEAADERIPYLLRCPAAVRFLSCEPLLGPIDLRFGIKRENKRAVACAPEDHGIHWWVIVGGESGPKRRPMDLAWARSIRDQCKDAGVPFFMKQVDKREPIPDDLMIREWPRVEVTQCQ